MSDVQVVQKSNPESLSKEKYLGEINILSRKRKLEETSGEGDEKPEVRKKLKWETIQRSKTGLHLEHAIYFKPDETKNFFQSLENEIEYLSSSESSVTVYGKEYNVPRLVAAYGDNGVKYTYSRRTLSTAPWTPTLLKIKKEIENIKKTKYNFVLVNKYENGEHNMGFHADDEDEIDQSVPICSVSFGASRDFTFLPKQNNDDKLTIPLHDGTVLFMMEPTQKYWKHAIPKRRKVKTARINLTFRKIFSENEDGDDDGENEEPAKDKNAKEEDGSDQAE